MKLTIKRSVQCGLSQVNSEVYLEEEPHPIMKCDPVELPGFPEIQDSGLAYLSSSALELQISYPLIEMLIDKLFSDTTIERAGEDKF